jgi:photosystem II stability/assembly factor-like uncharacterized protein
LCVKCLQSFVSRSVREAVAVAAVAVVAVAVEAVGNVVAGTKCGAVALVSKSQASLCIATVTASHGTHRVHDARGAE